MDSRSNFLLSGLSTRDADCQSGQQLEKLMKAFCTRVPKACRNWHVGRYPYTNGLRVSKLQACWPSRSLATTARSFIVSFGNGYPHCCFVVLAQSTCTFPSMNFWWVKGYPKTYDSPRPRYHGVTMLTDCLLKAEIGRDIATPVRRVDRLHFELIFVLMRLSTATKLSA